MVVLGGPWLSTLWIPAAWMKMGDRGPTLPAFLTDGDVRLELCQLPQGLPLKQSCYTWDFGAFNLRKSTYPLNNPKGLENCSSLN